MLPVTLAIRGVKRRLEVKRWTEQKGTVIGAVHVELERLQWCGVNPVKPLHSLLASSNIKPAALDVQLQLGTHSGNRTENVYNLATLRASEEGAFNDNNSCTVVIYSEPQHFLKLALQSNGLGRHAGMHMGHAEIDLHKVALTTSAQSTEQQQQPQDMAIDFKSLGVHYATVHIRLTVVPPSEVDDRVV